MAAGKALLHPDILPLGSRAAPGIFAGEGARATLCDIGYLLLEPGGGVWGLYLLDRLRVLGGGLVRIYGSNFG
jgi:hypothetical protein